MNLLLPASHKLRFTLTALAISSLLAGCGRGNDDNLDDRLNQAPAQARFVHAVPAGPNVTLARNGVKETQWTNVAYKFGSQYFEIGQGTSAFSLQLNSPETELATTGVDGQKGHKYTLAALPSSDGVALLTIDDPYTKSVSDNNARVRVINASPNSQNVDVYLIAPGTEIVARAPTIAGVTYRQAMPASGSDAYEFGPGDYQLIMTAAGSKTPIFSVNIPVSKNVDWLLVTLPETGLGILRPDSIRVLLVHADNTADATDELVSQ